MKPVVKAFVWIVVLIVAAGAVVVAYVATAGVSAREQPGAIEKFAAWHLVHFIRHLPNISEPELAEMAALNPKPAGERRPQSPSQAHTH